MLKFENIQPLSRESAMEAFASGDSKRICDALVAIAFYEGDWQWVQGICLLFLENVNPDICSVAAICLGHIARIHRKIDKNIVIPAIRRKMMNEKIKGILQDALDDIETFIVK